jgi:hypothetical protein
MQDWTELKMLWNHPPLNLMGSSRFARLRHTYWQAQNLQTPSVTTAIAPAIGAILPSA